MPKQLWAKSSRKLDGERLTLKQHLIDTDDAAQKIFIGRILQNWCRFFKVSDIERFLIHLRIAALFHDIGKANQEFYTLIEKNTGEKQTLRHEWISALLLHLPSVRAWLAASELQLDLEVITAAVLSHHLQAHQEEWGKPRTLVKQVELYLNHPEVIDTLKKIAQIADIEGLPELPEKWIADDVFWQEVYKNLNKNGRQFSRKIKRDNQRRSLLLAVKAGLIASDSVASAMFRVGYTMQQWLDETIHRDAITPKEIQIEILQRRYRQIREKNDSGKFRLKPFQRKAPRLGSRALLLSGCGSGKTIFAYKWMQSVLSRYKVARAIFLYPTRGTATEGFKDYVSWAPESDASLLTGTASYELQEIAKNPKESTRDKNFITEEDEKLYALGFWGKRYFSATVDQFLSFLTHSYGGICLLPVLTDSVIVIDEIHSFSRGMFDNLMSFLEHFDIPVLCMSATLPTTRQKELEKVKKLAVFASCGDEELAEVEKHPRYDVQFTDFDTARSMAIDAYQKQKYRVLWVVNTINRCREIAGRRESKTGLEGDLDVDVLTYHSRYKLRDRQNQHNATVAAFSGKKGEIKPAIAVTTQVCAMSLDLDADVLITELAPISSIVQRMGRSNRHMSRGSDFRAKVLIYEPENCNPYTKSEIEAARKFISEVNGEISQWYLANLLEKYSPGETLADGSSSFVSGGYWAFSESFRDINDFSVNALLDSDLEAVKALIKGEKAYDGYVLPVPKQFVILENRAEWMPKYMAIANHEYYCDRRGFGKWKS
ncbi:MAG: CRISPR-associated helicase Cas3' [Rivularia sp. (in: cyanobacteria)]